MTNLVTKRNSPWLSCLFVTILGCGTSQTAHRLVPPVLPPMEMEEKVPSTTPVESQVAKNDAPETPITQTSTTTQAIAKEPGHASGPCPAPSDDAKRMLARALAMEKTTTDPEPHRAITEAVRLRLDALFQHGCYRNLDDEHLVEAIAQIAEDPKGFAELFGLKSFGELGIKTYYGTYSSGALAHYRWHDGMIRTSMVVTGERGDMDKQLLVLSSKVAKLPSHPEPVLVIASTHPWLSSCWRALRIRIVAPSGDPIHPKILLDKPLSGRWCEGMTTQIQGDTVSFGYDGWGGPWSFSFVQRPYTVTYEYKAGAFVEHFGFPQRFENLPEDWLMREWTLSQEATVETHRGLLQSVHEMLHRTLIEHQKAHPSDSDSEYTQEVFPVSDTARKVVLYCAHRETNKPCKEWPKPVDFFLERRDGLWYVKDVVPRK